MKLPEHYEKWLDDTYPSRIIYYPSRQGAMEMYHKLMADLKPAIEALKSALIRLPESHYDDCVSLYIDEDEGGECNCGAEPEFKAMREALAQLKEKGLVEN